MRKMKAVEVREPKGPLQLVQRDVPSSGPGQVLIKVPACGICHSDIFTKEGLWPGLQYPRVPGHEIAGIIDAAGPGVDEWKPGERVGVGWHGGHCGRCERCRRGDFVLCERALVPGSNYPPAEPGALFSVSRSKRLKGDADASPAHCAT